MSRPTDPVLLAHGYPGHERIYSIGGLLGPASIRDQMLRGQWLVQRLIENRVLTDRTKFAVIGGGAGGVTAAWIATRNGVPTTLYERRRGLFDLQIACSTRWIDPVQYDWAVDHHSRAHYPWGDPDHVPVPLPWAADTADKLGANWDLQLKLFQNGNTPIDVQNYRDWRGIAPDAATRGYRLAFHDPRTRTPVTPDEIADVVLLAVGFGTERSAHGPLNGRAYGFPFWATDPYAEPNMALPPGEAPRVLICGAGDGAIQDLLRIVFPTVRSALELYRALGVPRGVEHRIQSIQAHVHREYSWGWDKCHDHPVLGWLQKQHFRIVRQLLAPGDPYGVRGQLDRHARAFLSAGAAIDWAFPCTHFGQVYGLNRFLASLVSVYLRTVAPNAFRVRPKLRLKRIVCHHAPPPPHDEQRDPLYVAASWNCHGRPHTVEFWRQRRCEVTPPNHDPVADRLDDINVLVLRNGVDLDDEVKSLSPLVRRQLLPFSLLGN